MAVAELKVSILSRRGAEWGINGDSVIIEAEKKCQKTVTACGRVDVVVAPWKGGDESVRQRGLKKKG